MAHYAFLNMDNIVTEVIVGKDENNTNTNWELYYQNIKNQICKRTSYNTSGGVHKDGGTPFRGNYAGIGYTWDEDDQIFWPKKPYASWVKNNAEARWQSPIGDAPALTQEQQDQNTANTHRWNYVWNEEGQS